MKKSLNLFKLFSRNLALLFFIFGICNANAQTIPSANGYASPNYPRSSNLPQPQYLSPGNARSSEYFAPSRKPRSEVKFYVGADGIRSNVRHTYQNDTRSNATSVPYNGIHASNSSFGFGFNAGVKIPIAETKIFSGLELFYDQLDNKTKSPWNQTRGWSGGCANNLGGQDWSCVAGNDNIKIDHRYGAKLLLGYKLLPALDIFATGGVAHVGYHMNAVGFRSYYNDPARVFVGSVNAPIFGGGANYNINDIWSLRFLYELQTLHLPVSYKYQNVQGSDKCCHYNTRIDTFKVGVAYNF